MAIRSKVYLLFTSDKLNKSLSEGAKSFKIIRKECIRLITKNVETFLFLKYILRALSYSTSLYGAPEDFILPNSKNYDVWDPETSDSKEVT